MLLTCQVEPTGSQPFFRATLVPGDRSGRHPPGLIGGDRLHELEDVGTRGVGERRDGYAGQGSTGHGSATLSPTGTLVWPGPLGHGCKAAGLGWAPFGIREPVLGSVRTLLIVDEVGYLPMPAEAAAALFQVISQRYLKGSIALTTNLGIASWGKAFNDDPMIAAVLLV